MAKKNKDNLMLDLLRKTRERTWVMNPVTKIVKDKKKEQVKKACRGKVVN